MVASETSGACGSLARSAKRRREEVPSALSNLATCPRNSQLRPFVFKDLQGAAQSELSRKTGQIGRENPIKGSDCRKEETRCRTWDDKALCSTVVHLCPTCVGLCTTLWYTDPLYTGGRLAHTLSLQQISWPMVLTSTAQYTPVVYWVVYRPSLQKAGQMLMLSVRDHTWLRCVLNDFAP
jgi:hypothetical protein